MIALQDLLIDEVLASVRVDVKQFGDPASKSGLLVKLTHHGVGWMLTMLDAPTWQGPRTGRWRDLGKSHQKQASVTLDQPVRGNSLNVLNGSTHRSMVPGPVDRDAGGDGPGGGQATARGRQPR